MTGPSIKALLPYFVCWFEAALYVLTDHATEKLFERLSFDHLISIPFCLTQIMAIANERTVCFKIVTRSVVHEQHP